MNSPADTAPPPTPTEASYRGAVGIAAIAMYLCAGIVLAATGNQIRYSADHHRTISIWEIWIPVTVCLVAARLIPWRLPPHLPEPPADRPRREARVCVAIALAFAVAVIAFDGWYIPIKVGFLVIVPMLVLGNRTWLVGFPQRAVYRLWWWTGPATVTAIWLAITWLGPYARTTSSAASIAALLGVLVLNVYIEERFYRGWLQTRLEHVLGRWPAIGTAALLWAVWHLAIHTTQRPVVDTATVVAHHGTVGILLGYLWARFRNPWPLLIIHAAINTPVDLLRHLSIT